MPSCGPSTATGCQAVQCCVALLPFVTPSASSFPLNSSLSSCLLLSSPPINLTHNDDLDQVQRKVKVGQQIASKQSALSVCGNGEGSPSLFVSPSWPSLLLLLSVCSLSSLCMLCLPEGFDVCQGGLAAGMEGGSALI